VPFVAAHPRSVRLDGVGSEHLRASKDRPPAVPTGVSAGRQQPSGAKSGVLTKSWSTNLHRRACSTSTLRKVTNVVDEHTREALAIAVECRIDANAIVAVLDRLVRLQRPP
jgi:hypothetical protein